MVWDRLRKYCLELNIFSTDSDNAQVILQQRWSTRVYIVMLSIILIVVAIIAGFNLRSINEIVYSPSKSQFIKMIERYPNTLRCPCSRIGIAYETFVRTHVNFHQVCLSTFVTQTWINSLFLQSNNSSSASYDIRYYLRYFWEVIAGFCFLSNSTWIDAVTSFGALRIVSPIAVVGENLRSQAQAALDNSMLMAQSVLVRNLIALRGIIAGNQFVSGLTTNFYASYPSSSFSNEGTLKMLPRTYNNCSCLNFFGCPHPIIVTTSTHQLITIPGMIGDCFIVDATLASTLECYYNSTCFALLHRESIKMARDHTRNFLSTIVRKMIALNFFKTNGLQTPMNIRRQQILTRFFILILVSCSITVGLYIFLSDQDQLVTIEYPSLVKYESLYEQHSSTLLCPCSQISVPYDRFLNVTFVLHQICTSSLVSSMWLDYLVLVNLNRIPIWTETDYSRDFRTYGASYFKFLATYCHLAQINIEDAKHMFLSTQFINNYLPSQLFFLQQVQHISESFIAKTRHEFSRTLNWTQTATMISQFLTGANTNFRITVNNDGRVIINDVTFRIVTQITHNSLSSTGRCSCGFDGRVCFLIPIIYTNGSSASEFLQVFYELKIGCIPMFGLFCILSILMFYSSIIGRVIRKTYLQPSIEDYEHLLNLHPDGVDCPCTRISIPYNTFVIQLEVKSYHQACTTDVIEQTLIMGSIFEPSTTYTNRVDFQSWRFSFVDGLQRLCRLAEDSITNDIQAFLASTMLVYQLIPRTQFDSEMNVTLNRVKLATPVAFTRILDLLRLTIHGNALIDVFSLSWNMVMAENSQDTNVSFVSISTNQYTKCSCITERSCSMAAQLFLPNDTSYYTFQDDQTLERDYGLQEHSTGLPPAIIAIIVISAILCFAACLSCCIRSQQHQRAPVDYVNSDHTTIANPYQLQDVRSPARIVLVRPINNVGAAPHSQVLPSIYEGPPPSYDVATGSLSSLPPPFTARVQ
ncbi:unnamed protein product [Rotaria sp. Silwood1]|nr:unnamed protein product [Rotaria sp. Silwood1]CAF4683541.1 unnamed protein product [Rotaria sp. Silwood1]